MVMVISSSIKRLAPKQPAYGLQDSACRKLTLVKKFLDQTKKNTRGWTKTPQYGGGGQEFSMGGDVLKGLMNFA